MIMEPTCTNLPALHAEFILAKLKVYKFAFGIIYYDNTVPADDLTTQKASAGVNLTYFSRIFSQT